ERRAEDGGEVADVLGDEEVVLHAALDLAQAGMLGVAEAERHLVLQVEGEPLFGAAGEEMQMAAHRPEKIAAAAEERKLGGREDALPHQIRDVADAVDVFRNPEQRVQVAQAALTVLDVRLDEVA